MGYDMTWRNIPAGQGGYFRLTIFGMARYRELMTEFGMAFCDAAPPPWPRPEDFGLTEHDCWVFANPENFPDASLAAKRANAQKMFAELQTVLTSHVKEIPGIPLHKLPTIPLHRFCGKDGWIVLPAECVAAAQAWRTYCATHGEQVALQRVQAALQRIHGADARSYWCRWITYLGDAAAHDGFVVRWRTSPRRRWRP
jgi:hypothetical protein